MTHVEQRIAALLLLLNIKAIVVKDLRLYLNT